MAVYNEILVGRFNRGLQKLFAIKGPPPVPQLSSEIMAIHPLGSGVENRYIEGWTRYWNRSALGPVGAQINMVRFRNPAGSNVIAVFEKFLVFNSLADSIEFWYGPVTVDLATVLVPTFSRLDPRGNQNPTLVESQNSAGVVSSFGANVWEVNIQAAAPGYELVLYENQEVPLLPGDGFMVSTNTVNSTTRVLAMWRERPLEESERA